VGNIDVTKGESSARVYPDSSIAELTKTELRQLIKPLQRTQAVIQLVEVVRMSLPTTNFSWRVLYQHDWAHLPVSSRVREPRGDPSHRLRSPLADRGGLWPAASHMLPALAYLSRLAPPVERAVNASLLVGRSSCDLRRLDRLG